MNAWDYGLLAWLTFGAVLSICLIGQPRTGKWTPLGALFSIAFLAVAWMAVSS